MDRVDRLLRESLPLPPPPDPEARERARARLLAAAAGEAPAGPRTTRAPRAPRGLRLALAGVAAAALGVAVLQTGLPGGDGSTRADAATVRLLDATARTARAQPPAPVLSRGRWLYTRSLATSRATYVTDGGSVTGLERTDRRAWIAADGRLRLVTRTVPLRVLAGDPALWRRAVRPAGRGPEVITARDGRTTARMLAEAGLPDAVIARHVDDPEGLARLLREAAPRYGGQERAAQMWTMVGDGLRESLLSPDARAALFRAAAHVPGVRLVGPVRDARGRLGMAVARTEDGVRDEIVLDPATSALLAEREVVAGDAPGLEGVPPGTVVGETTYLRSGLVSSPRAVPAG